ncbi:MAG: anti-sigma factor [Sphingomonas adhaesiva]|uniref:anti-sigma factor n=1 Tax=Sphingomonas adhaesiva TaxID=28212 RepID=UPI002FFAB117
MTAEPDPSDPSVQAAELALGLLEADERAAALRRVASDPDFAREVAVWRERFSDLVEDYPAVDPAVDLLPRIDDAARAPAVPRSRAWRWFAGGLASGALAASLTAVSVLPRPSAPVAGPMRAAADPAPMIAVLVPSRASDQAPVAAWLARRDGSLRLTAAPILPPNRSAELWSIGADKVPRPLGLLSPEGRSLVGSTAGVGVGDTLAVSIEPVGGSRTGRPTGPILMSGVLTRV